MPYDFFRNYIDHTNCRLFCYITNTFPKHKLQRFKDLMELSNLFDSLEFNGSKCGPFAVILGIITGSNMQSVKLFKV